mmetsp:Transcript_6077/g.9140  ORF Transcript_6077/g.9140 Transcript_6077/m.9140 type:complete len:310 (-) Transcript_6077:147-1076(-)
MCRQTKPIKGPRKDKLSILLTSSSFHCTDEKDEKGPLAPSKKSVCLTIAVVIVLLTISERILRYIITTYFTHLHPVLEIEENQHILARHIGVDAVACYTISTLGYMNRHILSDVFTTDRKAVEKSSPSHVRIYNYQPEAHRILLIFLAYQIKNTHDSWVWNDGAIFIAHHIFAGLTAWFGMYPGIASMYGLFFMGMSEISTCVLCLLANFDPRYGVPGLDTAFPMTKIVLAVIFAVVFFIIRVMAWPVFAYHFLFDSIEVLKRNTVKETSEVKFALKMMVGSCIGLTALQILWFGEIIVVAKAEIAAMS